MGGLSNGVIILRVANRSAGITKERKYSGPAVPHTLFCMTVYYQDGDSSHSTVSYFDKRT